MYRFITLILLLLLALACLLPMDAAPAYRSSELERIKDGDTIEYRLNGKLTYASDRHYARMTKTRSGNQVIEQYFDADGSPAKQSAGHYALRRVYDGSLEVQTTYLDADLRPIINTSGYSTLERVYQDGKLVEEWYQDENGNPVANDKGAYGRVRVWEGDRDPVVTYVDASGAPLRIRSGYAEVRRTYYEEDPWKGLVKDTFYFDEAGQPIALSKGEYGVHYEYDESGTKSRTDYLGPDGKPISSTVHLPGSIEMYYDADGQPQRQPAGYYGIQKSGGKTFYLDAQGKRIFKLNRFLQDNPLAVVTIGTGVLLLSLLLPRRGNLVLLVLYVAFILYMTLWERDGESRAQLELFWSYRQFFSSPSLRLEILNNIWLFIPLGGILAGLGCRRGILLCLALSAGIELTQYFTGLGLAELDDLISNTLGGALGYGLHALWRKRAPG